MRVDCDTCVCVVCGGSLVVITLVSGGVSVSLSVPWWAGVTVYREGHGVHCTQPTASPGHTSASDSVRCRHYQRDWRPGGEKGEGVSLKNRVRELWWSLVCMVSMWSLFSLTKESKVTAAVAWCLRCVRNIKSEKSRLSVESMFCEEMLHKIEWEKC